MSFNKPIGGSGFGNAFDLSSLKKPTAEQLPTVGLEVTQENLVSEFVAKSKEKVVVLLAWSPRSAQAKEILETLGKLEKADNGAWILGTVNVDAEPEVAQALQVKAVPIAIAIVAEQLLPLFESAPAMEQVRLVINKLLELASQKGVGSAPMVQLRFQWSQRKKQHMQQWKRVITKQQSFLMKLGLNANQMSRWQQLVYLKLT